jgi:hypothetical protein
MRVPGPFWVGWLTVAAVAMMLFRAVLLLAPAIGQWMFNWVAFAAAIASFSGNRHPFKAAFEEVGRINRDDCRSFVP